MTFFKVRVYIIENFDYSGVVKVADCECCEEAAVKVVNVRVG
jgi:hypothetical protein